MKKMSLKRMLESAETGLAVPELERVSDSIPVDVLNLPEKLEAGDIAGLVDSAPEMKEIVTDDDLKEALSELHISRSDNQRLRSEHSTDASMFLDSEIDLDEKIMRVHQLALAPALFPSFIEHRGPVLLMQLLDHPNEDIGVEVLRVIGDLTDESVLEQVEDPDEFLIALVDAGAPSALTNTFSRLCSSPDTPSESVQTCLEAVGNIMEAYPTSATDFSLSGLTESLLVDLVGAKSSDPVWIYCICFALELAFDLVQSATLSDTSLGVLVSELKHLGERPLGKSPVEVEYRENLVDLVALCLSRTQMRAQLNTMHVIGVFVDLLRSRSRDNVQAGVRLCSWAVRGNSEVCNEFVDLMGLRVVGSILSGKLILSKEKVEQDKNYESLLTLVYNLLMLCSEDRKGRVIAKLCEHELEKLIPLIKCIEILLPKLVTEESNTDYLTRCDQGLMRLQMACLVTISVYAEVDSGTRRKILNEVNAGFVNMQDFIQIIFEYMQLLDATLSTTETGIIQDRLALFQSDAL
jgi:beta-catenin-like protein 1